MKIKKNKKLRIMKKSTTLRSGWRKRIIGLSTSMAMGIAALVSTVSLSACSSSDGEGSGEQINIEEYLAGKEWAANSTSGTYSYYKNHMVYYEADGSVTSGGLASEPNVGFGYWQIAGDRLNTTFTVGRPSGFDVNTLLNEPLSGLHLEENNEMSAGKGGSINIDQRPYIVGKFINGNTCRLAYVKKMQDISDDTDHDAALRGTWYAMVTDFSSDKKYLGSMTFNADGTMHMVIESQQDFIATYATKNGQVTVNGYLTEDNKAIFYYINLDGICIKLYNSENGYISSIWYKDQSAL